MRAQPLILVGVLALTAIRTGPCQSNSYSLYRVGIITSRAPLGSAPIAVPAMFVIDDTAFSRNPCGHGTRFTLGADIRVVYENGAPADTSALVIGRSVSVFITDGTSIVDTCPDLTSAAKVIIHSASSQQPGHR